MGRVNDLYMDELERRAEELVEQGLAGSDAYDQASQEAYDRLMATAPELLEALRVVTEFAAAAIDKLGLRDTNGIIAASRAIQAKATGR